MAHPFRLQRLPGLLWEIKSINRSKFKKDGLVKNSERIMKDIKIRAPEQLENHHYRERVPPYVTDVPRGRRLTNTKGVLLSHPRIRGMLLSGTNEHAQWGVCQAIKISKMIMLTLPIRIGSMERQKRELDGDYPEVT